MQVYSDAYFLRILDVLKTIFPKLVRMIGEGSFAEIIAGYLKSHPPSEPSVDQAGSNLSQYIAKNGVPPEVAYSIEFCAELAALEYLENDFFDLTDELVPAAEISLLSMIPEESWSVAKFVFHKATSLMATHYDFVSLIKALRETPDVDAVPVKIPSNILVFRQDNMIKMQSMEDDEARFLAKIMHGATFEQAVMDGLDPDDESATQERVNDVLQYFPRWFSWGLILGVNLEEAMDASSLEEDITDIPERRTSTSFPASDRTSLDSCLS